MRIEAETVPGRVRVLVEHHPALPVDAAAVAAAVHAVLAQALELPTPPGPGPAELDRTPDDRTPDDDVDEVRVVEPELVEPEPAAAEPETPAAAPCWAGRSVEGLRGRALALLDQGLSDVEVCARLEISRAQLLRWDDDLVGDAELARQVPDGAVDGAGYGAVLAVAGGRR